MADRIWKIIDGEPYMINPHLGILGANPQKKKGRKSMARRYGARHMAWVRSHKKHSRRRKHNPYAVAGPVAMLNPRRKHRRHRKHNPARRYRRNPATARAVRGFLGLPPVGVTLYATGGFVGTAWANGLISGFVPADWKVNADGTPNLLTKYGVILASILGVTYVGKATLGRGGAFYAGIGGALYAIKEVAHDFMPGVIPGLSAYTVQPRLRAYARPAAALGAPAYGAMRTVNNAPSGGQNIVAARFRRFQ